MNSLSSDNQVTRTRIKLEFPEVESIDYVPDVVIVSIIEGINTNHEGDTILNIKTPNDNSICLTLDQLKIIYSATYENLFSNIQVSIP